jgi:hypothetical protein
VPVLGIEDLQQPAPEGGPDRAGPLHRPQLVRDRPGGQAGRVLDGQEPQHALLHAQRRIQHLDRFVHVRRDHCGAHGGYLTSPQPIDQVFDTDFIKWVRHFRVRHG